MSVGSSSGHPKNNEDPAKRRIEEDFKKMGQLDDVAYAGDGYSDMSVKFYKKIRACIENNINKEEGDLKRHSFSKPINNKIIEITNGIGQHALVGPLDRKSSGSIEGKKSW